MSAICVGVKLVGFAVFCGKSMICDLVFTDAFADTRDKREMAKAHLERVDLYRMSPTLRADYSERRMVVLAKNLLRWGNDEFAIPADDCTEKLFEDLARMLIGQQCDFRRYRTVLPADSRFHLS